MAKIEIEIQLKENNKTKIKKTYSGILQDNNIKYSDGTINIYDTQKNTLKRKTKEYEIILDFKNNTALYTYNNFEMPLKLKTKNITTENRVIQIEYKLEENTYEYIINWR